MKLTKIVSMVMTSATVLSTVAAATPAITQATSQEGIAAGNKFNNGRTLPDNGRSKVGITFGKGSGTNPGGGGTNPDNPGGGGNPNKPDDGKGSNTDPGDGDHNGDGTLKPIGYLRLQHVPEVLDFGSYTAFNSANPVFTAAGTNLNDTGNDVHPGYAGADNQTPKLSTTDPNLSGVNGKTWLTVVDKQDKRTTTDGKNDKYTGSWQLKVKADGPLTTGSDANAKTIAGATLTFKNTKESTTDKLFDLTGNEADKGYETFTPLVNLPVSDFTVNLNSSSTAVQIGEDKGPNLSGGAYVFAWDPSDIKLTLPASASVDAGTYTTSLTWTLSTGIQ
ncbi:WxL domain-containing protein [Lactobacillus sp. ESL0228]|uniref:WxL domain-containing protein n=1 Tax=Lactobacillus sp. ESL0228 TaxID=2069352 RepID=UPI000EFA910F|nr:WxL domain-containing protein [Lactobacillus sp. ESL0228]RMC47834.1 cell surface protein [Lactobacillus sp. ESL0228]